jgi:hypothetical protein
MKRKIAAPNVQSWDRLVTGLRQEASVLVRGDLAALRWAPPPPPEATRQRLLRIALGGVRVVVVMALPIRPDPLLRPPTRRRGRENRS